MTRYALAFLVCLAPLSACSLTDDKDDEDEEDEDDGGGWFEADTDTDADSDSDTDSDSDSDTDTDTDSDSDSDSDSDTDSDSDADNPYSTYEGWETFEYGYAAEGPGELNCALYWRASGDPLSIPSSCDNCEFLFEVDLSYDSSGSDDDGTCSSLATDLEYTYGYTPDYYGYGAFLVYGYYGYYYARAYADFDGSTFEYYVGYIDYYYDNSYGYYPQYEGLYFTRYTAGEADVY